MYSPEEQQIEIYLLKCNLEEIENDLVVQRSVLPELAAENEQKYRKTMMALQAARALNSGIDRLKLENIRLTAKRTQLKKQCEDITESLVKARETRRKLVNSFKEEEEAIESEIRKYEESLRGKAEWFRKTSICSIDEEIENETEILNQNVMKLEKEEERQRQNIQELQHELISLAPDLPEDVLKIVGKNYLEAKLKFLTEKCDELRETRDRLLRRRKMGFKYKI